MNHILKIGFTTLLITTSLLMYSQQTYYNKSWDVHGSDWKADVLKHKGYYYTVGGSTFYSGTQWVFGMTMEKLDSLGNSVKYKEISDTSFAINASNYSSLVVSPTGSIYKVGYGNKFKNNKKTFIAYLYKTNTNLDSIFFKTYPPDTGKARIFENAIYYDHHIYAVGTDSIYGKSYQIMLMKLDTLGNIVWEKKYISPGTGMVGTSGGYYISKTADNGFAILGTHSYNIILNPPYDLRVLKLDSNGTQEWAKIIYKMPVEQGSNDSSWPCFTLGTSDGNIVVGAKMPETRFYMRLNLLKFDLQGNQLWRKKYGFLGGSQLMHITDAIEDKYGNYDILINESFLNSHLLKVSPLGDSLRMTGFGIWGNRALSSVNSNPSFGNSLVKEDDGGYTVVGSCLLGGGHDNWVARIDSNGCNMHGTPYNVTATPIQYNGKSAMKIEWQDSIVNPSRKYSVEVRFKYEDDFDGFYYFKSNPGITSAYSYIDTSNYLWDTILSAYQKIHSYRVRAVDSITNNVSCASEMTYILNIEENNPLQDIEAKFYPNPAKEFFYVEILNPEKEEITLTIHNLLGEQTQSQQFSARYLKEQINTKHLSKGIYIVSLQSQSGKLLKQSKVVVQ